jgi:hypothetical protein
VAIRVHRFEARHAAAVVALNQRLAACGSSWRFPESPETAWLAPVEGSPVFQELLLASDDAGVHGAYALQHRAVCLGGSEREIANWYLMMSEGAIDARYAMVATLLLRDVLRREPLNFVVGMGGMDSALAQLARRMGFVPRPLPSFVRVERGGRVAREARFLRQHAWRARLLDVAAMSGAAGLGATLARLALEGSRAGERFEREIVPAFGAWADELWQRCRTLYSFIERRDAAHLARIYPEDRPRLERLRVSRAGRVIGWAVLQVAQFTDNPNFGALHVGRITDCLAAPEDAEAVVGAAVEALRERGVDLMLSNQSHPAWCQALRRRAFLPAPSSVAFAASPELTKELQAIDPEGRAMHVNRGDGDGPWGLDPRAF